MTKTLTEKWKEKRIKDGMYYVMADRYELGEYEPTIAECYCCKFNWDIVKEVLAPVPSYDEWHKVKDLGLRPDYTDHIEKWEDCARLTKKLEIATKALKRYSKDDYYSEGGGRSVNPYPHIARKALKEMEGVK